MYKVTELKINCTLKLSAIPFSASIIKEFRAVYNLYNNHIAFTGRLADPKVCHLLGSAE